MSVLFALLYYVATLLLVVGLANKVVQYAKTPAPLKIPTTPAPTTQGGVVYRMAREVFMFESLFKSNKWIWVLGYLFHIGLALVLLRHFRYFQDPVWNWVALIQPFGIYAGFAMVLGLLGLLGRRIVVERIRYISSPSDYLMLILLIFIGVSGLMMKFVEHTDVIMVKQFMLGLMVFDLSRPLPSDFPLMVHLTLVAILMIIFPISKLLHAPGVFFSPSRNQVDNPRDKRHIAPWAAELDSNQ